MDVREGGKSLVAMHSPEGRDLSNIRAYRSIVPHQQLEFVQNFADEEANTVTRPASGCPRSSLRMCATLSPFNVLGEYRSELTVTEYGYVSDQILELSKAGLEQVLDKLATSLE